MNCRRRPLDNSGQSFDLRCRLGRTAQRAAENGVCRRAGKAGSAKRNRTVGCRQPIIRACSCRIAAWSFLSISDCGVFDPSSGSHAETKIFAHPVAVVLTTITTNRRPVISDTRRRAVHSSTAPPARRSELPSSGRTRTRPSRTRRPSPLGEPSTALSRKRRR